jgi:hypothetical protein
MQTTVTARSLDWMHERRKSRLRRVLMRAVSSIVGPVIRCSSCGHHGAALHFNREVAQWAWHCRFCRHARLVRASSKKKTATSTGPHAAEAAMWTVPS